MLRNNEFALGRDHDLSIEGSHSRSKEFTFDGAGFIAILLSYLIERISYRYASSK